MRTPVKTLTVISALFVIALCLLTIAGVRLHGIRKSRGDASQVRPTIFMTDSATLLPTFFSGLKSDPARFDLRKAVNSRPRRPGDCSTGPPSTVSRLARLFGLRTVQATMTRPSTMRNRSSGCAPSATRTPNSCRRWATRYEIKP